jgi:hypothetical protein
MFFENFSNPKYIGNTDNWVFPINGEFYDVGISESHLLKYPCRYESKMMQMKEQKSDSFYIDCYYSENNSPEVFSISLYDKNYALIGTYSIKNEETTDDGMIVFSKDNKHFQINNVSRTAYYYKIKVNSNISYLKIYGI